MQLTPTRPDRDDRRGGAGFGGAAEEPLLELKNLRTQFFLDEGVVRAVDDVSLSLRRGKTLGIVGESGCGKSVTARSILQVVSGSGKITDGQILFRREDEVIDIASLDPKSQQMRAIRGQDIAMIFQEPMAAFSPVHTVGRQIIEAIRVHEDISKENARRQAIELLGKVGIPQPGRAVDRYPFELSGGLRQRAMIAMALSCDPVVLIADEPTTALDVTVQAQILALLKSIQDETGMAMLMISHNMGVIAEMADDVAVMYLGRVIEQAPLWDIFDNPQHPYTRALLASIPLVEEEVQERLETIKGSVPNPYAFPKGCRFHPRCNQFMAGTCEVKEPVLVTVNTPRPGSDHQGPGYEGFRHGDVEHRAACFLIGGADDDQ